MRVFTVFDIWMFHCAQAWKTTWSFVCEVLFPLSWRLATGSSLRIQPRFCDATNGFPVKWRMNVTYQIWVVLLVGWSIFSTNQHLERWQVTTGYCSIIPVLKNVWHMTLRTKRSIPRASSVSHRFQSKHQNTHTSLFVVYWLLKSASGAVHLTGNFFPFLSWYTLSWVCLISPKSDIFTTLSSPRSMLRAAKSRWTNPLLERKLCH